MQHRPFVFILVAVACGLIGGYGSTQLKNSHVATTQVQKESPYNRVMRTHVIRCGYFVWPPLLVKDPNTGNLTGFYKDLTEALGNVFDFKIEWTQELNFSTYLQDLADGRYDAECSGGWPNAQRGTKAYYTKPYAFLPSVVIVRNDDTRFDQNSDLINSPSITIATIDGETSSVIRANRFPQTKEISLPSNTPFSDLILNVVTGKADITFLDPVAVQQYEGNNPGKIRALNYNSPVNLIALSYTLPQDDKLKQAFDTALDQMQNSGEIELLLKKYEDKGRLFLRVSSPYLH